MSFINEKAKQAPVMGCYGLGVGRIMACAVEESHDKYGIIWPKEIAPFDIQIILLSKNEKVKIESDKLYKALRDSGVDVIYDEREGVSPGVAFADADLIGAPIRVVFGNKNFENGCVELSTRDKSIKKLVEIKNTYNETISLLN